MLKLTPRPDHEEEPDTLLFPAEALRELRGEKASASDAIRRAEKALEDVQLRIDQLRIAAGLSPRDPDRPRAA